MKFRNIPRSSILYAKRAYSWRTNSNIFLSGDVFADSVDLAVFPPKFRGAQPSSRQVSEARIIFCPSDRVEEFFSEFKGKINAKVLILGNGDRDFLEPISEVPTSIRHIFCQNLNFEDDRYHLLPIGIENTRLATNGNLDLFSNRYVNFSKTNKVLIGPLSLTHSERSEILASCYTSEYIIQQKNRLRPREYADISSQYRFIGAPRGNGIDTHRFWETLYRGGVPIVKGSVWSSHVKHLDIPVVEIDSWSQNDLIQGILEAQTVSPSSIRSIPQLWWPWWESYFKSLF